MLSIVYSSTAVGTFDDSDLAVLLMNSRASNRRHGVTGLLLYREGTFVQLLEGPMDVVRERMAVIAADPRHDNVETQLEEVVQERRFPEWTMRYEPITDDMVDAIPGYRTTFDDIVGAPGTAQNNGGTALALRQLIGWYQDRQVEPTAD